MKSKRMLKLLALLASVIWSAACAAAEYPEISQLGTVEVVAVSVETSPPDLRLVAWSGGSQLDEVHGSILKSCGVSYQIEASYSDYWDVIPAMLAVGEAPDIFLIDTEHLPYFAESGFLFPLDMAYQIDWGVFLDTAVDAFTYQQARYAVPRELSTLALFYNRQMFDVAGRAEPNDDWTWKELQEVSWQIGRTYGAPGLGISSWPSRFAPFVFQNGGQIMSEESLEPTIDSWEAIDAGYFYTQARSEGWAVLPEDVGVGWPGEAFGRGDVAMVLEGYWLGDYLRQTYPDLDYGAVQPPAGPAGEGNLLFGTGYAVSAPSRDPEAALKAIECLTSEQAQLQMIDSGLLLPTRQVLARAVYQLKDPAARAIFEGVKFATPYSWGLRHDEIDYALTSAMERVFSGELAVDESFKLASEEIRKILGQ